MYNNIFLHFIGGSIPIQNEGTRDKIGKVQSVHNEAYGVPTELMNTQENVAYSSAKSFTSVPPASPHVYEVVNTSIVESEDASRVKKAHYDYVEIS